MSHARAYLDHAATTPVRDEVIDLVAAASRRVGNPSSLHASGRAARAVVEDARESVAESLGASASEVVFTSGGTEADNLAVQGLFRHRRGREPARSRILTSTIEHHAILDTVDWLSRAESAQVELIGVDADGRLLLEELREAVDADPDTVALISVMWANNEVGTLQPVPEVAELAARHGIPMHSDAVQAVSSVPVDFRASGLTAMSVTGHKLGGPVGVGALLLRTDAEVTPVVHGGGQERRIRSGTLDAAAAAGFALALRRAVEVRAVEVQRLAALRARLIANVQAAVPDVVVNGSTDTNTDPSGGLPGVANLMFPGAAADDLMMALDAAGIDVSPGSACASGVPESSHVLLAMGRSEEQARSSLRFSLGHTSTEGDIDMLGAVVGESVRRARQAGLMTTRGR